MILAVVMVFFLAALSMAQFTIVQKNLQQSDFMTTVDDLRSYADSAAFLSIHDLNYDISGYDGKIGTTAWTVLNDVGMDGIGGTLDKGEGDGYPTPGEPNLNPGTIGPASLGVNIIVHTADSSWANTKRVIATAYRGSSMATVEAYAQAAAASIPRVGAVFIKPDVALDLNGNAFTIDGRDTNPDGTPGDGPDTYGIATSVGSPAGSNTTAIVDQIPANRQDQIYGIGGEPSVGESTEDFDLDALFNQLAGRANNNLAPGNYANQTIGTASDPMITLVSGDIHLSGQGAGQGVLLVDGNMTMSGQFTFVGVVIVRGDVRQTGGGSGVHVYGSLMVSQSITVVDDPELTVSGQADIIYCSAAIEGVEELLSQSGGYAVVYWNYLQ
jgi:hypothetical protein